MIDYLPKVVVLLAAYNGIEFLEEQLQSILKQKDIELTIFISVDLSSDDSYEWCCHYAQQFSYITVLPYGEKFGGAAPNFFRLIRDVELEYFDYVALADQDDIWLEDKLITACRRIKKANLAAYSGSVLAFWSGGRKLLIDKSQPQKKYDYLFESAGPGCTYVLRVKPLQVFKDTVLVRSQKVMKVGLHDWLIYAFFRAHGYVWFIDPEYKMHYRQHSQNQVGINKGWRALIKRLRLFHSGWYKEQAVLIADLIDEKGIDINLRGELLKNIGQIRRRWQDRLALFILVLLGLY